MPTKRDIAGAITGAILATGGITGIQAQAPIDSIQEVADLQAEYHAKEGKYLQVLPGNRLPHYEQGSVSAKLGKSVADNMVINTYRTPSGGEGYQVITQDDLAVYSLGVGPAAEEFTYVYLKPSFDPSSTTLKQ